MPRILMFSMFFVSVLMATSGARAADFVSQYPKVLEDAKYYCSGSSAALGAVLQFVDQSAGLPQSMTCYRMGVAGEQVNRFYSEANIASDPKNIELRSALVPFKAFSDCMLGYCGFAQGSSNYCENAGEGNVRELQDHLHQVQRYLDAACKELKRY